MSEISTTILHTGYNPKDHRGAIVPPIHLSSTFEFGNSDGYDYSRSGNPTRKTLEQVLAKLDGADYGLAFSSGSAVLATVAAILKSGERILFSSDAYGGTYRYVTGVLANQGVGYAITDFTDLKTVETVLADDPTIRLIWVETPTNPLLKVADISELASIAHANGAILVVDNTFATPALQRPLEHGADIVAYSTTKYINGHSDSVGGSLATSDTELFKRLEFLQNAIGAVLSPFDSWLTLRGLKTLELRIERHVSNAGQIARLLKASPKVKRVYYPELFTGSQGDIVKKQMAGGGGIISVEIDDKYDVQTFLRNLEYFPLAESLGAVESLIDHPASMTHAAIPPEERAKIGLSDGLFRISVGIENPGDLLFDIEKALNLLDYK